MKPLHSLALVGLVVSMFGCAMNTADLGQPIDGVDGPAIDIKGGKSGSSALLSGLTLSVASRTQTTITLRVCAGASGAPAGFSVQWMDASALAAAAGAWPEYTGSEFCKASFSGNAASSRFPLAPDACTDVEIGNLFDEEPGVSFTCNDDLKCGTQYAFRSFAHGTSTAKRSEFTETFLAETAACGSVGGCTFTQGYWKTHHPLPEAHKIIDWPLASMDLGLVSYDVPQLVTIFHTPAKGNGLIALAHQLEAAKLNIANGADGSAVAAAISDADALIGSLVVPTVGTDYLAPSLTSALTNTLASYNEGGIGPGHCD